ncbi:helix-turn-helix domain-containing protein, partial [Petrimonas sp.]
QDKTPVTLPLKYEELMPKKNHLAEVHDRSDFQEATEVEITNLSLEDAEKEMIALALEKHDGKRKLAASELGISERTLYRKIKEYNLEKL